MTISNAKLVRTTCYDYYYSILIFALNITYKCQNASVTDYNAYFLTKAVSQTFASMKMQEIMDNVLFLRISFFRHFFLLTYFIYIIFRQYSFIIYYLSDIFILNKQFMVFLNNS